MAATASPQDTPRTFRKFSRAVSVKLTLMLLALLLAGCSTGTLAEQIALNLPESAVTSQAGNKLVVLGVNGNIYSMNPDGSNRTAITRDAGPQAQYRQPTWAPDGEKIAFTSIRNEDDVNNIYLSTAGVDGSNLTDLRVPFAPFYINWSPTSSRLAYISNWNRGQDLPAMALRLVDIDQAADGTSSLTAKTLAEGQPFYFSWSPDGNQLLTHIGNERLELQSVDGSKQALYMSTGAFPAPIWSQDGEQLVFALIEDGEQRLVTADATGKLLRDITDFNDRIAFTLNPAGSQLAYAVSASGSGALDALYVTDIDSLATRELSAGPVLAFFWSPDSAKLAFMEVEPIGATARLRWKVWNGESVNEYAAFLPTNHFFQNYLAYFDQYAQSMRIWSPDSTAFTYAGVSMNGARGIWVQQLDEAEPALVSSGIFAAWSPK